MSEGLQSEATISSEPTALQAVVVQFDAIPYDPATSPSPTDGISWLSLDNQLANGDSSHTYTWHDSTLDGTFATAFLNTTSLTFYTGTGGDGWSPQAGVNVGGLYAGFPTPANNPQNAYALIFVPDNLSSANTTSNPLSLAWNETTDTGSLGVAHTAYADYTSGGLMGAVGMTGTSAYVYGAKGIMGGVPQSEVIASVASVPEPTTLGLAISGGLVLLACSRRRRV